MTPKYPVMRVISSKAHHSEQSIKVYGTPILRYSDNPMKLLESGQKIESLMSSSIDAYIAQMRNMVPFEIILAMPVPTIPY